MLYLFYHTLYYNYILRPKSTFCTLGEKPTFYPEITKNLMLEKCDFCEKWDFEIVNFVKNETSKL